MIRERIVNNYIAIHHIRIPIRLNKTSFFNGAGAFVFGTFQSDDKFEIIK